MRSLLVVGTIVAVVAKLTAIMNEVRNSHRELWRMSMGFILNKLDFKKIKNDIGVYLTGEHGWSRRWYCVPSSTRKDDWAVWSVHWGINEINMKISSLRWLNLDYFSCEGIKSKPVCMRKKRDIHPRFRLFNCRCGSMFCPCRIGKERWKLLENGRTSWRKRKPSVIGVLAAVTWWSGDFGDLCSLGWRWRLNVGGVNYCC